MPSETRARQRSAERTASGYRTVPAGMAPLEYRAVELERFGVRAFDMMVGAWSCPRCPCPIAGPSAMILPFVHYRLLADLVESVSSAAHAP